MESTKEKSARNLRSPKKIFKWVRTNAGFLAVLWFFLIWMSYSEAHAESYQLIALVKHFGILEGPDLVRYLDLIEREQGFGIAKFMAGIWISIAISFKVRRSQKIINKPGKSSWQGSLYLPLAIYFAILLVQVHFRLADAGWYSSLLNGNPALLAIRNTFANPSALMFANAGAGPAAIETKVLETAYAAPNAAGLIIQAIKGTIYPALLCYVVETSIQVPKPWK